MVTTSLLRAAGDWRLLGWFWAAVAAVLLGTIGGLAWLGPPPGPALPGAVALAEVPAAAGAGGAGGGAQGYPTLAAARTGVEAGGAPAPSGASGETSTAGLVAGVGAALPVPPREDAGTTAVAVAAIPAVPPPAPEPPPLVAVATRAVTRPGRPIPPPDPALLEPRRMGGQLPRIAPDGRTSIRVYAAGFDRADTRPRVGVVLAGIGLSATHTEEAVRRLPSGITLALNPYTPRLDQIAARIRERGMEMLIAVPMEPSGYPLDDPGPQALLTGLPLVENLDRLDWALARSAGYVGVMGGLGTLRGERFAQMGDLLGMVQDVLRSRGLLYVDPRPGAPGPARAWGRAVDVVLDEPATRGEIERRLAELERIARERGSALGLAGDATPVVVERLAAWAAGLGERGLALAPVTALIRRPEAMGGPGEGTAAAPSPPRR